METIAIKYCPICKDNKLKVFCKYDAFTLLNCENCDLIFQDTINEVNIKYINNVIYDDSWVSMRNKYLQNTFLQHVNFNTLLLDIFSTKKGDLLEIGSGTGEFIYLAQSAGWNAIGIEPSTVACSYALENYGVELINAFWNKNTINTDKSFDAIVFWHLLEHIVNPIQFLNEVSLLLRPNGLIFFSVPNKNSFTNKVFGYNSPLFLEIDHFFHYSQENLKILINQIPLEIITIFSREEPNQLFKDIIASLRRSKTYQNLTFQEMMALMAHIQGNNEGHELFCVAKHIS